MPRQSQSVAPSQNGSRKNAVCPPNTSAFASLQSPLFDDQPTLILGDVALDPQRPQRLWVGTGENNSSRSTYGGMGVYRSDDAGRTFEHVGLGDTDRIGRSEAGAEIAGILDLVKHQQSDLVGLLGQAGELQRLDQGAALTSVAGQPAFDETRPQIGGRILRHPQVLPDAELGEQADVLKSSGNTCVQHPVR